MNPNVAKIAERMGELEQELERELERELEEKRRRFRYELRKGRAVFEGEVEELLRRFKTGWVAFILATPLASLLVAPVIYSLFLPLAALDAWLWLYQAVCFRVYGIERVERSHYILLDRWRLPYLNWIERFNCDYCGYANGLIAYAREIASRTEQYFCPIKHSRRCRGPHRRYGDFVDFGDAETYHREWQRLRDELKPAD